MRWLDRMRVWAPGSWSELKRQVVRVKIERRIVKVSWAPGRKSEITGVAERRVSKVKIKSGYQKWKYKFHFATAG